MLLNVQYFFDLRTNKKKACLKNILILQAQHEKSEIKNLIQQKFYKKKRLAVRE